MKSKLLIMGVLCAVAFTANAQKKGTNALSFGVNVNTEKQKNLGGEIEIKTNSYSIGYGNFIKDNTKIGFDLNYSKYNYSNAPYDNESKNYGGNVTYQKYFPLVKTLYAYAGGRAGYNYGTQESTSTNQVTEYTTNTYNVGAFGGITWFLSKRFAFETSLLSANASYAETKQKENSTGGTFDYTRTSFNLTSEGFINNLGFKVYILF
ncbi:outer membrane beta-barrel protein [Pedobacter frigiditerrae]|uniref:outer membrane beta-barrel protein n=1 Tax=Pedobacter frigiditerrae TaxID=2530452 RepID=UPI00293123B9|nr:outer membrane beta-barrel protein [Pedobacter frigiditerrae]